MDNGSFSAPSLSVIGSEAKNVILWNWELVNLWECFVSSQQKKLTKLAEQLFKATTSPDNSNYRLLAASFAG